MKYFEVLLDYTTHYPGKPIKGSVIGLLENVDPIIWLRSHTGRWSLINKTYYQRKYSLVGYTEITRDQYDKYILSKTHCNFNIWVTSNQLLKDLMYAYKHWPQVKYSAIAQPETHTFWKVKLVQTFFAGNNSSVFNDASFEMSNLYLIDIHPEKWGKAHQINVQQSYHGYYRIETGVIGYEQMGYQDFDELRLSNPFTHNIGEWLTIGKSLKRYFQQRPQDFKCNEYPALTELKLLC